MIAQRRRKQLQSNQCSNPTHTIFKIKSLSNTNKLNLDITLDFTGMEHQLQNMMVHSHFDMSPHRLGFQNRVEQNCHGPEIHGHKVTFKLQNQVVFQRSIDSDRSSNQSEKSIMIAKPMSNFCRICLQNFDDYLKHIEHPIHKKRYMNQTKSTKLIDDLLQNLQYKTKRPCSERSLRVWNQEEDEFMYKDCSSKMRIIQNQRTVTSVRLIDFPKKQVKQVLTTGEECMKECGQTNDNRKILLL